MDIIMPKMGESVSEGTIIKWHKNVGDVIKQDEIIFEISTDKVDTEIPAASSGVLSEILVKEGETVEVGTVVARIQSNDISYNEDVSSKSTAPDSTEKSEATDADKISLPINSTSETQDRDRNDNPKTTTLNEQSENKEKENENIIEIAMPKMGESVMEGTIIKWLKKVGDAVKKDETIFEISTDKVDTEIPSPEAGTLAEILVGEQETVEVGTIVAKLAVGLNVKVQVQDKSNGNETISMHDNFAKSITIEPKEQGTGSGFFSPLILSIAQKENVSFDELKSIQGTGLDERVTKKDVLNYIEKRKTSGIQSQVKVQEQAQVKKELKTPAPTPSFVPTTSQSVYNSVDVERIPMDNIRQMIMDHMILSRDTSVHVTELIEVDMTRIHNFI